MRIDINSKDFHSLDTFFSMMEMKLTHNPDYPVSRDFNGFEEILMGGYGVHDYEEPLKIVWKDADKSKEELGYEATMEHLESLMKFSHPANLKELNKDLIKARNRKGPTLFDIICDIFISMDHIELILK